jgi:hypothetical protein
MRQDEPPGFEDAPEMARAGGAGRRYGADGAPPAPVAPAPPAPLAPAAAPPPASAGPRPQGRDEGYREEDPDEEDLPHDLPDAHVLPAPRPLSIPEKYKIVLVVAPSESGPDLFSAINPDGEYNDPQHPAYQRYHIGLSWGLVQFTQRGGALGRVLEACRRRDPDRFRDVFGDDADELVAVTTAPDEEDRLRPVGGSLLWNEPWLSRFRAAGRVPPFQAAQNEVAIEGYMDPNLGFAALFGLDTDRALAMLYDRCVDMGNGGGRSFVARAVGPIQSRRQLQAALSALGKPDLRAFQEDTPGLEPDGRWNALTHAAICDALRELGDQSPVLVPALGEMLDRMVAAAAGRRFEARLRALRASGDLRDTVYEVG